MEAVIGELEHVDLITAPDAELGLELVRAHRPALVILDVNLPGMSGVDALALLRGAPETRDLPVLGLSAAALGADRDRAERAGFSRYLTKPVSVDVLTCVVEQLLRGPSHSLGRLG